MSERTGDDDEFAAAFLRALWDEGFEEPYSASVRDFTPEEKAAGKLREADERTDRMNIEAVRRVLDRFNLAPPDSGTGTED